MTLDHDSSQRRPLWSQRERGARASGRRPGHPHARRRRAGRGRFRRGGVRRAARSGPDFNGLARARARHLVRHARQAASVVRRHRACAHPQRFCLCEPGDTHSYQSVAPRTQFFGIVAPGGWEQCFVDGEEVLGVAGLPVADHPFDFLRMGPAMDEHRIMRVESAVFAEATPTGADDRALPGAHVSYFVEAGFGTRRTLLGHLSTAVLTAAESDGFVDMRVIEGWHEAALPPLRHRPLQHRQYHHPCPRLGSGGKGGLIDRLLAARGAGSAVRFTASPMLVGDRSPSI